MPKLSKRQILGLFALVVALYTLPVAIYLVQQRQIIEKKAAPTGGIPYGPIMFGMNPGSDYNSETLTAFSGGFLSLYYSGGNAEGLLKAARDNGLKVIVGVANVNPCTYWNNKTFTFNYDLFMQDANQYIPIVARYYPDTVVGVGILNEPHWINHPTDVCYSGVPPKYIYNLIKRVREAFAAQGVTDPNLLIGPNSHPGYIDNSIGFPKYEEPPDGGQLTEEEKKDETINMLWIYYDTGPVNTLEWAKGQQEIAKRLGVRIIYNANAANAGSRLPEVGIWHCQQDDAAFVTWWSWAVQNQAVSLSSLIPVGQTCDGNVTSPTPSPAPTVTPTASPIPTPSPSPRPSPIPPSPTPTPSPSPIPSPSPVPSPALFPPPSPPRSPTPTPTPVLTNVCYVDINISKLSFWKWWRVTVEVRVVEWVTPIDKATLEGHWSGAKTGIVSGRTNKNGKVRFRTGWMRTGNRVWFTVDRFTKDGQEYILTGELSDSASR